MPSDPSGRWSPSRGTAHLAAATAQQGLVCANSLPSLSVEDFCAIRGRVDLDFSTTGARRALCYLDLHLLG
jgi:hypothetical protein